jgi:hypothetical protein
MKADKNKDTGWIKLYRSSFENKLYFEEPFTRYQAWIDLLLLANHKDSFFIKRGTMVKVPRGTVGYSMKELAKRWKWSINKVSRFIEILESDAIGQVKSQKNNLTTLISIVNYNRYQSIESADEFTNGNQTNSQTETNKNVKNDKEDNKIKNIPHFQHQFNNIQNGGLMPPPTPPAFSVPDKIFTASDFKELPNQNVISLKNFLEISKQVLIGEEEIQKLWEVFKVQELTGVKPYINKEDVYRHFLNWSKRQSYAKTGRAKKKESILKPFVGEIKGLKFSEDFTHCEMEDGTLVKLDANKRDMAMSKLLSPQNVKK